MRPVEQPMIELSPVLRLAALGGVIGPVVFVATWIIAGSSLQGYAPVDDAISELARDGATTKLAMTTAFLVYGVGLIAFAVALRSWLAGRSWWFALANGVAALGVAAAPLGSSVPEIVHVLFALLAYVTLCSLVTFAAADLTTRKRSRSRALGLTAAVMLAISVVGPDSTNGLFQRGGLTLCDAWVTYVAFEMFRKRSIFA